MDGKLLAYRSTDQISSVGVKPLLDEQVDLTEIHDAEIDRELLAVADP
jgi:hypothetical protein